MDDPKPKALMGVSRRIDGNMQHEQEVFQRTLLDAEQHAAEYDSLRQFCLFIGYPKSGHSVLAQALNAHPDVCISHEMNCLAYYKAGYSRNQILSMVLDQDRWFARRDYQWSGYSYLFDGLSQGSIRDYLLMGDKKGGSTTSRLSNEPELLDQFLSCMDCDLSFIHITRNPYDMITTLAIGNPEALVPLPEACERIIQLMNLNQQLIARIDQQVAARVISIRQEDLLANPRETIEKLLVSFSLPVEPAYLDAVCDKLFKTPKKTRYDADWPDDLKSQVGCAIEQNRYFAGYSFDRL